MHFSQLLNNAASFEDLIRGFPWDLGYESWYQKNCSPWATQRENCMIIQSLVLSQYQHVMDGWTDGQT